MNYYPLLSAIKHPIVFINTANHAMSYRDTNRTIWKWEYIPWEENGPVILEEKSREELETATWDIYSEDWIEKYQDKYRNGMK